MYYGSPSPIVGIGLSTPDDVFTTLSNSVGTPATITNISGDSEKITYFTPRLVGIQLGLSYTPDSCEEGTGCGGTYAGFQQDNDAGQQSEIVEVAGNYVTKLSALDVALYAGYAKGKLEVPAAGSDDQEQWGVGAEFGFAGFTFGAAYKDDDQGTTGADTDRTDWSVGILYGTGPWTVGVEYVHAEVEEGAGLGTDETDGFQIGGSYDLGPGILLTGGVTLWDVQDNLNNPANENDGLELIFGTVLEF